jgi:FtsZ-binding cell division protein ZapB
MDRMDHLQAHAEVLEQQTEHLKHQTHALEAHTRMVERRQHGWRDPRV